MKKHHIISAVLAILAIVGLITYMFTQHSVPQALAPSENIATTTPPADDTIVPITKPMSEKSPVAGIAVGEPYPIIVRGTSTCLEFRNQTGPHIMSCAIGLKATDGKFYGLSDTDSEYKNISKFSGEGTFEIKGLFTPVPDPTYISEGVIKIESVTKI